MNRDELIQLAESWFSDQGWTPFPFQKQTWKAYLQGKHGLLNAPTGSGKTYALWVPVILDYYQKNPEPLKWKPGIKAIWITPLRALSLEIKQSAERLINGLGLPLTVAIRSGDTTTSERAAQKRRMPDLLITTPESLQLLLASKDTAATFKQCRTIITDEWHELLGSKRGVQMELAISRLKKLCPKLRIWGISATIGNLEQAMEVLIGREPQMLSNAILIQAKLSKRISVKSILPEHMDSYPWRGHMGLHLLDEVAKIIRESRSTLIFTNVRSSCEIWYLRLLERYPEFAGVMAMHHSSIDRDVRIWVENAIRDDKLKVVVCTSSLDLGVDFAPVETIIQVGGPKGVARFVQRAGRSNHRPGEESRIWFLATHAIELVESSALRRAVKENIIEDRTPYLHCWDVLIQYLNTLATGDGFYPEEIFAEVAGTFCYQGITVHEWSWILNFIVHGSQSIENYDEYHKVNILDDGKFKITGRRVAMHHRMQIGTIVSDAVMQVKFLTGGYIGTIEESFASKLKPGDAFQFAGRKLELHSIKNMQVVVRKADGKPAKFASWNGGRLALSAQMSEILREELYNANHNGSSPEIRALKPVFERQRRESIVPDNDELLIETFRTREGFHLLCYPFEGRMVHEALASVLAWRISLLQPVTFSLAYNDYGFELLSDQQIDVNSIIDNNLFTTDLLHEDLQKSINSTEMARRKFRDIAVIAGLVFTGMPGKFVKTKHLQSSTQLLFEVFRDYEPDNLLLQQAFRETYEHQLEEGRLITALERINAQKIVWKECIKPTPFSFPIITDRLRERLSSETLEDRIKKMIASYTKE